MCKAPRTVPDTHSKRVDAIVSITFIESAGLTLLQRLHVFGLYTHSPICVYAYSGENVHRFLHGVEPGWQSSEKESPNPLTQTPQ